MTIALNPSWTTAPPARISQNADGSVTFPGPVGDVLLPQDYLDLLRLTDGLGTKDGDAWFLAQFRDGPVVLELEWLGDLFTVMNRTWRYAEGRDDNLPVMPAGHVFIGFAAPHPEDSVKGFFDVLLGTRRDHPSWGRVFAWPRSDDPWMQGENTHGLGHVADNFPEFLADLTTHDAL